MHDIFIGGVHKNTTVSDIYELVYQTNVIDVHVHPRTRTASFFRVSVKTKHIANVIVTQLHGTLHKEHTLQVCHWHERYGVHRQNMKKIVHEAQQTLKKNITMEILPENEDEDEDETHTLPNGYLWSKKWGIHTKETVTLIHTFSLVHNKEHCFKGIH